MPSACGVKFRCDEAARYDKASLVFFQHGESHFRVLAVFWPSLRTPVEISPCPPHRSSSALRLMSAAHPAYHIILGKLHNDRVNDRANERLFVIGGFTADKLPDAMQNYLHNINARISNPLRIRIGGN